MLYIIRSTAETFHLGMTLSTTIILPALCVIGTNTSQWRNVLKFGVSALVSGFTLYILEIEPFLSTIDIHLAFCGMMGILKGKLLT
jgi:hypothetical protein